jgi:CBS domain-containing protein
MMATRVGRRRTVRRFPHGPDRHGHARSDDRIEPRPLAAAQDTVEARVTPLATARGRGRSGDEVHGVSVVDDAGKLVGVCTRRDLSTASPTLADHERPAPDWLGKAPRQWTRTRASEDARR